MHAMNFSRIDLNLLVVFDAVMAERNVTRAASRLFLSQPAVSHALARLRRMIGDPLFVRSGRQMVPTAKASALGPAVHNMLEQLGAVLDTQSFDPTTSRATFRIGLVDFGETMLAPLLAGLLRGAAPGIRFVVQDVDTALLQAELSTGQLDLAIALSTWTPGPGIHSRKLREGGVSGLVRKGHPLAQALGKLTARQFAGVRHLLVAQQDNLALAPMVQRLARAGMAVDVAYSTRHMAVTPHILMGSDLVMIAPELVADQLCRQYGLVKVALPAKLPTVSANLVWPERTHRDPGQKWLREQLLQYFSRLRDAAGAGGKSASKVPAPA
jgi:DNA-binding transcriptional LysR family regulator